MDWLRKLGGFLNRRALDAELEEEIHAHLRMKAEACGGEFAARRQFGNETFYLEESRAAWRWPRLDAWMRDLRYALRGMRRNPGFSATVVATLGLAIGSASVIYSLVDAVILRPLRYPESDRLVALSETRRGDESSRTRIAPGRLEDWQEMATAFEEIGGVFAETFTDTSGSRPERVSGAFVSPRFFAVMRTAPQLGRVFTAEEERYGGPAAILLSDGYWRRRFGGDPAVIGRSLALGAARYTVVGVMPPSFQYPAATSEVWIARQANPELVKMREARFYAGVARLKPGATLAHAKADLDAVTRQLADRYPNTDAGWTAAVAPLKEEIVGGIRPALWLLSGAVSVLLLIGCANVACLLLARLNARAHELATRRSLGAGRAAIARQLFVEGVAYALAGGLLGVAAAFAGADLLRGRLPDLPRIRELSVDARTLALITATSLASALLFSLAPILQTLRRDLAAGWMRRGRGVAGSRQRLPRLLVVGQFALATALLIGAGLFLRTLARLEQAPLGFRADTVLSFHAGANLQEDPDSIASRHQRLLSRLSAAPGVRAVAMTAGLPAVDPAWPREFEIVGERAPAGVVRFASWRMVTAGYFQALGVPLVEGRTCRMNADPLHPFEAIVNRAFVERYLRGREPVGRFVTGGPQGETATPIVGVAADVREDGPNQDAPPVIYGCGFLRFWPDPDILLAADSPAAATAAIRGLETASPVYGARPLADALSSSLDPARFRTLVVTLFSAMALALAAIGLYGLMAYSVSARAREIGVRLALGARGQILGSILRSGAALAVTGAAAGVGVGAAAARWSSTLLYGVRPFDLASYAIAVAALFAVAIVACVIPARRAIAIEPSRALRDQ